MLSLRFSQRFLTAESNFQGTSCACHPFVPGQRARSNFPCTAREPIQVACLHQWNVSAPCRFTSRGALCLHSLLCHCNHAEKMEVTQNWSILRCSAITLSIASWRGPGFTTESHKALVLFGIKSLKYIQQLSETRLYFMFLFITIHDVILELHNVPAK